MSKEKKRTLAENAPSREKASIAHIKHTNSAAQYSFKAVFVIAEHGYADEICEFLFEKGFMCNFTFQGKGTANNQLLGLLGLGDSTRDVVISIAETEKTDNMIQLLTDNFETTGIVFSIRLSSIGGRKIINFLQGKGDNSNVNKDK